MIETDSFQVSPHIIIPLRSPAANGAFPLGTPAALLAQTSKLASNSAFALLSLQSRNRARIVIELSMAFRSYRVFS
jgi:hypothetical protein